MREGIVTAAQVRQMTDLQLLKLENFGRKSLREVREVIGSRPPLSKVELPENTPPTKRYNYDFSLRIRAASQEEAFELLRDFVLNRMGAVEFKRSEAALKPEPPETHKPVAAMQDKRFLQFDHPSSRPAQKAAVPASLLPKSLQQRRVRGRRAAKSA
jgi:hypothetical protein